MPATIMVAVKQVDQFAENDEIRRKIDRQN